MTELTGSNYLQRMMDNKVAEAVVRICRELDNEGVDYMVVGGIAVAVHGYPRFTADLDIWYNPTNENYLKILRVLANLGNDVSSLEKAVFDPSRAYLRIPGPGMRTEFLPKMLGLESYRAARQKVHCVTMEGHPIKVIALDDLILNKETLKRPGDIKDAEELRKWLKK